MMFTMKLVEDEILAMLKTLQFKISYLLCSA